MKKKNRRLAIQISLIVTLMFILALLLIGWVVLQSTKEMYFESKNEKIEEQLSGYKTLLMNPEIVGWVLDQWQSDPGMMLEPATEMEKELNNQFIFSRFVAELDDIEDLEAMEPKQQRAYLKALYRFLAAWMDDQRLFGKFDSFYLLDIRSNDEMYQHALDDYFVIMECSRETDQTKNHRLGEYWSRETKYSFLSVFQADQYSAKDVDVLYHELSDGHEAKVVAAAPVFLNGEVRYVVCLEYSWAAFASILNHNLLSMALWGGVSLLIVNALLILFIYFKAVRPMVQVNAGIHAYMENKDSAAAVQSMNRIRQKNEIGKLADSIAAMTVEIDRYTQENLKLYGERERVTAELDLAAKIQKDSLPAQFPDRQDIQLFASMVPAKEVGGDFYDFFLIDDDHLGLVIADVSGKGIPAALFMMMSKDLIKNYAMMGLSPAEVLKRTNVSLCENNRNNMFVTVWFGILDLATGHAVAANGGHEYPMLRKATGDFELFKEKHGMMLGALKGKTYTEYEFDIEPGGTLFVYTDGAPEATDVREKMFGTDRMLDALNQHPAEEPETLLQIMKAAIDQFVGDAPQFDDLTMLCVKYLPHIEETDCYHDPK